MKKIYERPMAVTLFSKMKVGLVMNSEDTNPFDNEELPEEEVGAKRATPTPRSKSLWDDDE